MNTACRYSPGPVRPAAEIGKHRMTSQSVDIAVVGAGIVGISCAYFLALSRRTPKVVLIDPLQPMSLTSAASGEIRTTSG